MLHRLILILAAAALALAALAYGAFQLSPWPSALLIRRAFDRDAVAAAKALQAHVPAGIAEQRDLAYDAADPDARLDLFRPAGRAGEVLPLVVWVHGGAWISGSKDHVANYLRILAGRGFAVAGVDYAIAPGAQYPTPVRQVNAALGHLVGQAGPLGLDPARVALAGDSAGAQIAAQLALVISADAYAATVGIRPALGRDQLRAVVLHCGGYDVASVDFEGAFGGFLRTVFWSYFGRKDFAADPRIGQFSVVANLTADFPPAFISAGNADPLLPQSRLLAATAERLGVPTDTLFFPADHQPPLGHEYQFNLDSEAGRAALERSVAFLRGRL
jgi:acetyl esterase/lipase